MPQDGYRLITTTYEYFQSKEVAKEQALRRRGQGKRTEIITEREYHEKHMRPMQDLTEV